MEEAAKEESRKKSNSSRRTIISSNMRKNREINCLKFETNNVQTAKKTKITKATPDDVQSAAVDSAKQSEMLEGSLLIEQSRESEKIIQEKPINSVRRTVEVFSEKEIRGSMKQSGENSLKNEIDSSQKYRRSPNISR